MILLRPDLSDYQLPKFLPGDLVRHVRYHYRGVVVAHDPKCLAEENWYLSNNTQPGRNQPWYHVLVHESGSITYPAESSLALDESGEEIVHPLLDQFFSEFEEGRYKRNDVPWPETNS
jgi:heat shock protein HspQ